MPAFNVRLVNVYFLLSSIGMSCMSSFQRPFHYKKLLLSNENICCATYLCSCDFFVSLSRAVNYIFFTYFFLFAK